jgi:ClpP class serine protease
MVMELWMMDEIHLRTYLTARARIELPDAFGSGLELSNEKKDILSYDDDGTPHIAINGILTQNGPDIIDMMLGYEGTSYRQIVSSIKEAHEQYLEVDDESSPIFLHVNSPGGTVNGAEHTASVIASTANERPIIGINEGVMASAALWAVSGATKLLSRGRSPLTGSIGVIQTVVKYEGDDVKIYNFTNPESPNKSPDPGTEDGAKTYTDRLSKIYSIFRDDVVAGRHGKTSNEKIAALKGMVVTAEDAVDAGLIDEIISLESPAAGAGNMDGNAETSAVEREETMQLSDFLKENPDAQAELDSRISKARSEGEEAAADRHAEVVAKVKPFLEGDYPERVKTKCAGAIAGTCSVESVLDLVAVFDELKANYQSRESDAEQDNIPDTPSAGPDVKPKEDESAKRDAEWNKAIKGLLG